jgi:hypothetical protein
MKYNKFKNRIVRRLNKLALSQITTPEEFMETCENAGFNENQLSQIKGGFCYDNLTIEEVKTYAKPEFNADQMYQIRCGLSIGFDVSIYAKPEFEASQMQQIKCGLRNGVDVSIYAKPEFDYKQMYQILDGFECGLDIEDVKLYAKPEFNADKMKEMKEDLLWQQENTEDFYSER